jgi:hypothetical protein
MAYQAQPASGAKHETDRWVRHERTHAEMKPLDGPPKANGEDDEFKNWE